MQQKVPSLFPADRIQVASTLTAVLQGTPRWDQRFDIEWYVWKCIDAGFAKTPDQIRLCAERYIAGKRKITPPGTARRKRDDKRRKEQVSNVAPELMAAVEAVVIEQAKAAEQYRNGNDKAINAMVGGVMKKHKADPAVIRELLINKIKA